MVGSESNELFLLRTAKLPLLQICSLACRHSNLICISIYQPPLKCESPQFPVLSTEVCSLFIFTEGMFSLEYHVHYCSIITFRNILLIEMCLFWNGTSNYSPAVDFLRIVLFDSCISAHKIANSPVGLLWITFLRCENVLHTFYFIRVRYSRCKTKFELMLLVAPRYKKPRVVLPQNCGKSGCSVAHRRHAALHLFAICAAMQHSNSVHSSLFFFWEFFLERNYRNMSGMMALHLFLLSLSELTRECHFCSFWPPHILSNEDKHCLALCGVVHTHSSNHLTVTKWTE